MDKAMANSKGFSELYVFNAIMTKKAKKRQIIQVPICLCLYATGNLLSSPSVLGGKIMRILAHLENPHGNHMHFGLF
jgi:hypothetical protein